MNMNSKRDAALDLLAATGIWRNNYAPPLSRSLWSLGFNLPPPHFASFWGNFVLCGAFFGVAWGLVWWFFETRFQSASLLAALLAACCAGFFFGLCMATYYAYGARKHRIPRWHEFQVGHGGNSPT
jgi:hypothetical protein